jgi:hypothetical protein
MSCSPCGLRQSTSQVASRLRPDPDGVPQVLAGDGETQRAALDVGWCACRLEPACAVRQVLQHGRAYGYSLVELAREATGLPVIEGERSTHRRHSTSFIVLTSPNRIGRQFDCIRLAPVARSRFVPAKRDLTKRRDAQGHYFARRAPQTDDRRKTPRWSRGVPQLQHLRRSLPS